MTVKYMSYNEARPLMQAGDVIAFGGKGHFSEIIKMATFSPVSHVGTILKTKVVGSDDERYFNEIVESTSLNGFNGVNTSRFSDRLDNYEGEIWWLPLSRSTRDRMDDGKFYDYLFNLAKERVPYDMGQAVKSALDMMDGLSKSLGVGTYNQEDFSKMFCSELVSSGLEVSGAVDAINCSEVTPIDLCRWNIYHPNYYQLISPNEFYSSEVEPKRIPRFNTCDPSDWNV